MNITQCVFGILCRDQKILMVKNLYKEFGPIWGIPGGKQNFGENFHQTLSREFTEETGIKIQIGNFVTLLERVQPARPFHMIAPVFQVFSNEMPLPPQNDTVVDFRFFSKSDLLSHPETIMNRKELIRFLSDPASLPPISFLEKDLDSGPFNPNE